MKAPRGENFRVVRDGGSEKNQVRAARRGGRIGGDRIDRAALERELQIGRVAADADDVRCDLRLLQRQGKTAADEADADDGKLHSFRLAASAARNLSFSCGVPTVTRRCSGSP